MKAPLILCLALLPILTPAQDKPVFKAGAATSNITPPLGMTIVGNFAPQPIAKHVHDELHVRCLVLDDDGSFGCRGELIDHRGKSFLY